MALELDYEDGNIHRVLERVFIGDATEAQNKAKLKRLNITHINSKYPGEFTYKHIEALGIKGDTETQNLREHFEPCFTFIEQAIAKNEGVLVHCGAGISRSATVVIAYLMNFKQWKYDEAREFLQNIRPLIDPNEGFVQQLIQFEKELFESTL